MLLQGGCSSRRSIVPPKKLSPEKLYPFQGSRRRSQERLCARFTDALIFVSRANVDYAAAHGIARPEEAVLIRSGVALAGLPAPVDAAKLKMSAGIGMHKPLVVSIGNLK